MASTVPREKIFCPIKGSQPREHLEIVHRAKFEDFQALKKLPPLRLASDESISIYRTINPAHSYTDELIFESTPGVDPLPDARLVSFSQMIDNQNISAHTSLLRTGTVTSPEIGEHLYTTLELKKPAQNDIGFINIWTHENPKNKTREVEVRMGIRGESLAKLVKFGFYTDSQLIDLIVVESSKEIKYFLTSRDGQPTYEISEVEIAAIGFPLPRIAFPDDDNIVVRSDDTFLHINLNSMKQDFASRLSKGQLVIDMVAKEGEVDLFSA